MIINLNSISSICINEDGKSVFVQKTDGTQFQDKAYYWALYLALSKAKNIPFQIEKVIEGIYLVVPLK